MSVAQPNFQIAIVPVTAFRQNCLLIWDKSTKLATVVDPGGEVGRILNTIDKFDLKVEAILLTHGHLDHAGGARPLKEELNRRQVPAGLPPIGVAGPDQRDEFLLHGIEEAAANYGLEGMMNVTPDWYLKEGDELTLAGMTFKVLHTPGHTPGHLSFVNEAARFAIVGDVLFRGGVGRTDFPYGDHAALIDAIHTKLLPLGDDISFLCGHGEGSTFGAERASNSFLQ